MRMIKIFQKNFVWAILGLKMSHPDRNFFEILENEKGQ